MPKLGDWVEVRVVICDGAPQTTHVDVLTAYRGVGTFPPVGSEYLRLNSGAKSRTQRLRQRGKLLAAVRAFFSAEGVLEVETPRRVRLPGMEPYLAPLGSGDHYLITSPEFHLKRLVAGGLERIYSLGPCWRGEEQGDQHLTEFTMLEWYEAHQPLTGLMDQCERLVRSCCTSLNEGSKFQYQGREVDLAGPVARMTVAEVCLDIAGVDLLGVTSGDVLADRLRAAGLEFPADEVSFEQLFNRLWVERVDPELAQYGALFVTDFPAPLAALSRINEANPAVCDRFELYLCGVELANAFGELTDPAEQRQRFDAEQEQRRELRFDVLGVDEKFLSALSEGLPPTSGIALGIDRLLMVLVNEPNIGNVVSFSPEEI